MSTSTDPEMHIEHDENKRDLDIIKEIDTINHARSVMTSWQSTVIGYTLYPEEASDLEKLEGYKQHAREAADEYAETLASCSRRAARIDFISAALKVGKTDDEIRQILAVTNDSSSKDGTTVIFKALVMALGGTMSDLGPLQFPPDYKPCYT